MKELSLCDHLLYAVGAKESSSQIKWTGWRQGKDLGVSKGGGLTTGDICMEFMGVFKGGRVEVEVGVDKTY